MTCALGRMTDMRKRSSYKPKQINPLSCIVALQGAQLLSRDDQVSRALALSMAVDDVESGEAGPEEWKVIFEAINHIEAFSRDKSIMTGAKEFIDAAHTTVLGILEREKRGQRSVLPEELQVLRDLTELWAAVLGLVTHAQYFKAETVVNEYVRNVLKGRQ